jgi:hypothetical protein
MGLGKPVENEVLEYLSKSVGGEDLLMKYVNTGMQVNNEQYQFFRKNKNFLTSYLRSQLIAGRDFNVLEFNDLISLNRKDLFKHYVEKRGSLPSSLKSIIEKYPDYLKLYIEALIESGNMSAVDDTYLLNLNDRDLIIKYLSTVKKYISGDIQRAIADDPELFLIYSRNKLQEEEADKTIDDEEDKFASIKTMVKIAQILDFKKKYKLADIITKKLL